MGDTTEISWCDKTFNPWEGCQKVGPGCDNCYAESRDNRFHGGAHWGPGAPRRRTSVQNWNKPKRWNREAAEADARPRVFSASLADVFDNQVPNAWRSDLWSVMDECPNLDWLIVTKRVGNVRDMVPDHWKENWPSNVWLLITVCNQEEADRDIPKMIQLKRDFRIKTIGLSMEPLLGPVDLARFIENTNPSFHFTWLDFLDWIIVGGEDGPRPMHPDWVRAIQFQCAATMVRFHFKQWGAWLPWELEQAPFWKSQNGQNEDSHTLFPADIDLDPKWDDGLWAIPNLTHFVFQRVPKKNAGCLLDGVEYKEFPA